MFFVSCKVVSASNSMATLPWSPECPPTSIFIFQFNHSFIIIIIFLFYHDEPLGLDLNLTASILFYVPLLSTSYDFC